MSNTGPCVGSGALTAMDAQIGRIRAMLRARGIEKDTLLTYTA